MDTTPFNRFQFIQEALNGTGGFSPNLLTDNQGKPHLTGQTHLIRYPRESDEKFARRCQVAWYRNFLHTACLRFSGYLSKKSPTRTVNNPLLSAMADDCDWRNNNLDVFWGQFALNAKARGSMLLLVDMPRVLPNNQADQMDQRAFPYLVAIKPERVVQFELDERGMFRIVAFSESRTVNLVTTVYWRVYTENEWWVQKPGGLNNPELRIEGDVHGLGINPVLIFTEVGDFPYVGNFAQIADISKRYFNAASERDEILRSQTFSLLTYKLDDYQQFQLLDTGDIAQQVGTHNLLKTLSGGAEFIAPPSGPAEIYHLMLDQLEESIKRIALTVEQPTAAESGVALTIRFQELNSALTSFARRVEDLERRMWVVASRWLGIEDSTEVHWPPSYELTDLEVELQTLQTMQSVGLPEEVLQEQAKLIVTTKFGSADAETIERLIASVEESIFEPPPPPDPNEQLIHDAKARAEADKILGKSKQQNP